MEKNYDYPNTTKGSRAAAKIRSLANHMTKQERSEFYRKAMQVIRRGCRPMTNEERKATDKFFWSQFA